MKFFCKNEDGFTLIEMMVVLLVISIILLVTIPNVTKHNESIHNKGCEALKQMVQTQVQAYQLENNRYPESLEELKAQGFIEDEDLRCPNGRNLELKEGKVKEVIANDDE